MAPIGAGFAAQLGYKPDAFLMAVAIGAWLVTYGLSHGYLRFNYPSLARYPVQGVDVSHHQGDIHWAALKSPRVRFAYIKATEGATFQDSAFATNWRGAAAAGIVPGAYHYFTLCRSGADQAANFIATTGALAGSGLPPAVDLEFGGNCAHRPTVDAFEAELQVFLTTVGEYTGCRPVLYVTERCVFRLADSGGLELIEIAPGVDLERDILARMDFAPAIRSPSILPGRSTAI